MMLTTAVGSSALKAMAWGEAGQMVRSRQEGKSTTRVERSHPALSSSEEFVVRVTNIVAEPTTDGKR